VANADGKVVGFSTIARDINQGVWSTGATVGSLGAQRAYQAVLRLEELGGAGDVTGFQQAFPEAKEAVKRL
jgi:hypothetical protein